MARIQRWLRSLACCCQSQYADDDLPVEAETRAMRKKKKSRKVRLMEMNEKLIREVELRESLQAQWEKERNGLMEEIANVGLECQSWREKLEEALMTVNIKKKQYPEAQRERLWMKAVWGARTSSVQKNEDYKNTLKVLMQDKMDMERKIQGLMQQRGMEKEQYRRALESLQTELENVKSEAKRKETEQETVIKELKKEIEELKEVLGDKESTGSHPGQTESKDGERKDKQAQGGDGLV